MFKNKLQVIRAQQAAQTRKVVNWSCTRTRWRLSTFIKNRIFLFFVALEHVRDAVETTGTKMHRDRGQRMCDAPYQERHNNLTYHKSC